MKVFLILWATLFTSQLAHCLTIPGFTGGNTCSNGNNCTALPGNDYVEPIIVNTAGHYRFDVSGTFFVADLKLGTAPCLADITEVIGICGGHDYITCMFLNTGIYYLTVDCNSGGCCGTWQVNVTNCAVFLGETAANPIIIPNSLPYNTSGNTDCHDNDIENNGCVSGSSGPDIFYRYTPTTNYSLNITFSNNGTPPYYGRMILDGVCYTPAGGCCVTASNYPVTAGVPVNIVADACCRHGGMYQLQITENLPPPCLQFCDLYFQDNEACNDGYVDTYNGGCDAASQVFQTLDCGSGVCARTGTFVTSSQNRADNDWYQITLATPRSLALFLRSEIQTRVRVYQRGVTGNGCPDAVLLQETLRDSCTTYQWSLDLGPATYWIAVSPQTTSGVACGKRYVLSATCNPPACTRDYCSSSLSVTQGVNYDTTVNSCCAVDNLPSYYTNGCFTTAVTSGPDIIHFLWLQTADTIDIIASSPALNTQIMIFGFCFFDPYSSCVNSRDLLGLGQQESFIGLSLPAGFYSIAVSGSGATCGNIRTQIRFTPEIPASPQALVILPVGNNVLLAWQRVAGASQYHVHRDTVSSITPVPVNLIGSTTDSTYIDNGIVNSALSKYFYVVTAE